MSDDSTTAVQPPLRRIVYRSDWTRYGRTNQHESSDTLVPSLKSRGAQSFTAFVQQLPLARTRIPVIELSTFSHMRERLQLLVASKRSFRICEYLFFTMSTFRIRNHTADYYVITVPLTLNRPANTHAHTTIYKPVYLGVITSDFHFQYTEIFLITQQHDIWIWFPNTGII